MGSIHCEYFDFHCSSTGTDSLASFGVVDDDFIPSAPSTLVKTGQFSKNVSVIIGWNTDDGSLFTSPKITNDSDIAADLSESFPGFTNSNIARLLELYPVEDFTFEVKPNDTVSAQYYRASRINRDIGYTCPGIDMGYHVAKYSNKAEARFYELNQSSFTPLYAGFGSSYLGISHFSDIPYVFNEVAIFNASASDTLLAKKMSGSWASFAATGNPVAPSSLVNATTLSDWPAAYANTKAAAPTTAVINVIGGPSAGPATISVHSTKGQAGMEKLLVRCAYISGLYDQLET